MSMLDKMTACAYSDKPAANCHPNLQFSCFSYFQFIVLILTARSFIVLVQSDGFFFCKKTLIKSTNK